MSRRALRSACLVDWQVREPTYAKHALVPGDAGERPRSCMLQQPAAPNARQMRHKCSRGIWCPSRPSRQINRAKTPSLVKRHQLRTALPPRPLKSRLRNHCLTSGLQRAKTKLLRRLQAGGCQPIVHVRGGVELSDFLNERVSFGAGRGGV